MKNISASTGKPMDIHPLESIAKLLGKRLRSKVLINNLGASVTEEESKEEVRTNLTKRQRIRKD